jgi:hypothetical protein
MQTSRAPLLIVVAAGMLVFGAVVVALSRRSGDRGSVAVTAVGLPGAYLGFCAAIEGVWWLYLPAGALLLAGAAMQVIPWIRSDHHDAHPGPGG